MKLYNRSSALPGGGGRFIFFSLLEGGAVNYFDCKEGGAKKFTDNKTKVYIIVFMTKNCQRALH